MHPSLDLANLTRLPTKLRLLAEIAVKDMTSDLNPFMDELEATPRTASHLLCVAYALLDTSDADRLAQILPEDHDSHAQLRRVLDAMGILAFLIEQLFVETEAFHALWPRVWRWTGILTDSLDATNASVKLRSHLYSTVLRAFEAMRRQAGRRPECFRLLLDSEGYYTVLGTAWSYLLSPAGDRQGLMRVSGLLSIDRGEILTSNPSGHKRAFDGLVAGAGGSWDSLARLIVGHIRFVCPSESSPINEDSRSRLEMMGVIALLYESARSHYLSRLRHLLAKRGLVPALVIMSRAYLKAPLRFTDSATTNAARLTRHNLLDVLGRSLETPNPRKAVVKALQAGILSAFFECSEDSADDTKTLHPLGTLIYRVLAEQTVYGSVLSQLRISLREVAHLDPVKCLPTTEIAAVWIYLQEIIDERLRLLDLHANRTLPNLRPCHNPDCNVVREKAELKRCSGCSAAYYCSRNCQRAHYHGGGHRDGCFLRFEQRRDWCEDLGPKDRSFLRTLLRHAYERRKEDISLMLLANMHNAPNSTLCTMFDFSGGELVLSSWLGPDLPDDDIATQLALDLASQDPKHAEKHHDGRISMHIVGIPGAYQDTKRWFLMPLRSATAELHDFLRGLATQIPPSVQGNQFNGEQYRRAVKEFLSNISVTETY